jgi:hypothetical protein
MTVVLGSVSGTGTPVYHSIGDRWELIGTLTFSSTYAAGGDTLDLSTILSGVGVGVIDKVSIDLVNGYHLGYNYTTKKITVWDPSTNAELANGAYPAAITGATPRVLVVGR